MKLLLVQSSSNPGNSLSKKWAEKTVHHFQSLHPDLEIETLDLSLREIPHLKQNTIAAAFTPPQSRTPAQVSDLQGSDLLIDQFLASDILVLGVPMYNFTVPSSLKAYIDQIVRVGRTFEYTATGPRGLVSSAKKIVVVTSSGGIYSEGPYQAADFLTPYLKTLFGFLGVQDLSFVQIEGTAMGPAAIEATEAKSAATIQNL